MEPRLIVNLYATHRKPPPITFVPKIGVHRDRSDPDLVPHLEGFCGYIFARGGRKMTAHLHHLMQHVQRVQHHFSIEVEEEALESLCAWAAQANAIMFYQDGSIRDDYGLTLLDPRDGSSHPDAEIPFLPDALERKARSHRELERMGVVVLPSLPPIVASEEVRLRTPDEVARRALALLVVALRAESLNAGAPWPVPEMRARYPLGFEALSPREKTFMWNAVPETQAVIDHSWRYEALALLLWALELVEELPPPVVLCDAKATVVAATSVPADVLIESARLRSTDELLDAADLHYRLHWAARQAVQVEKREPPASLVPGVLAERRHALNWLLRFEDADWDHVKTPT